MKDNRFEDQIFETKEFNQIPLPFGDYSGCEFRICKFSGSTLSGYSFTDCSFYDCDLSLVKLEKTSLKDVRFTRCKLLGVHFESCADFLFSVSFSDCLMDLTCFFRKDMRKTRFHSCSMKEADFTETDLTEADFDNCRLTGAQFNHTILEQADFRTATGFAIDPSKNRIKKARFTLSGLPGLVSHHGIVIS